MNKCELFHEQKDPLFHHTHHHGIDLALDLDNGSRAPENVNHLPQLRLLNDDRLVVHLVLDHPLVALEPKLGRRLDCRRTWRGGSGRV